MNSALLLTPALHAANQSSASLRASRCSAGESGLGPRRPVLGPWDGPVWAVLDMIVSPWLGSGCEHPERATPVRFRGRTPRFRSYRRGRDGAEIDRVSLVAVVDAQGGGVPPVVGDADHAATGRVGADAHGVPPVPPVADRPGERLRGVGHVAVLHRLAPVVREWRATPSSYRNPRGRPGRVDATADRQPSPRRCHPPARLGASACRLRLAGRRLPTCRVPDAPPPPRSGCRPG